jgi:hypothetical protein
MLSHNLHINVVTLLLVSNQKFKRKHLLPEHFSSTECYNALQPKGQKRPRDRRVEVPQLLSTRLYIAYVETQEDTLILDRGIGAMICERFASEGCNIAVNYVSSEDSAKDVAAKVEKHSVKAIVVQGVCPSTNRDVKENSMLWVADNLRMPVSAQTMQESSNPRPRAWAGLISSLPTPPGPGSRTNLGTSKMD